MPRLSRADALGTLIETYLDPKINLSPAPALNGDGSVRLPGLDNHGMGTLFEELVLLRRFCRHMTLFAVQGGITLLVGSRLGFDFPLDEFLPGLHLDPTHAAIHLVTGIVAALGFAPAP